MDLFKEVIEGTSDETIENNFPDQNINCSRPNTGKSKHLDEQR